MGKRDLRTNAIYTGFAQLSLEQPARHALLQLPSCTVPIRRININCSFSRPFLVFF
jgi:hypothetical protein